MQVNKYIPHYQRIPAKLQSKDLKIFQNDFKGNERMEKIEQYIVDFDKVLLDTIILNREKRYNEIYYHQTIITEQNESTPERNQAEASMSFAQASKITKSKKKDLNKNNVS